MKLKKNDIVSIKIEDITNLGFGVGKYDGAVIFVNDTVPGDEVKAKIIKAAASYCVGRAEEYVTHSILRGEPRCENTRCRACAYRALSYESELEYKTNTVRQAFIKEGLSEIHVENTIPSPKLRAYRNKAQYPISRTADGEYVIGFYAPKSHNVCEAADCLLSPPVFYDIILLLRKFFKKYQISVYDEKSKLGLLRHIYLRYGEVSGDILLTLVINGDAIPHEDELTQELKAHFPKICGFLINKNNLDTNVVLGDEYRTVYGTDYITDTLCGVKLKIAAPSFYQVNHGTAELIYTKACELAELKKSDTLLDIYCGAGSIGLSMAKDVGELIGIEIVPEAIECAKYNAEENGITNAHFFTGDAADTKKLLDTAERSLGKEIEPDVIILDPPRAGCDEALINYAASLAPRKIVYISCNPTTLARDVKRFAALGYNTDTVQGYDMFPMTGHVESVVCLTRRLYNELPMA